MRIINFGSLNIDKVYQVEQFVRPGQTITAKDYAVAAGGKGLNQSLAAARAGAEVLHAGAIGTEGRFMADQLPKIAQLHERIGQVNPACELEVDGGIDPETSPLVKQAGANVLVAGSAVFRQSDRAAAIAAIRNA